MKFLYNHIKHYFTGCKDTQTKSRWIQFQEKKNKPPEKLLEMKSICLDCDNIVKQGYFREDELGG